MRQALPSERQSITHKFSVNGLECYLIVGLYPDGMPGELYVYSSKTGSTLRGLVDGFATMASIALQYGVPLTDLVEKFKNSRFEPMGYTPNDDIPYATSIIDYIFQWLELKFLNDS